MRGKKKERKSSALGEFPHAGDVQAERDSVVSRRIPSDTRSVRASVHAKGCPVRAPIDTKAVRFSARAIRSVGRSARVVARGRYLGRIRVGRFIDRQLMSYFYTDMS